MTGRLSGGVSVGDGSWTLTIFVTDLQVERSLRVRGDLHIGGVMIRLVDELDIAMDWSDHAIWWPEKNLWLDKTRWTLDQYNITADAIIQFTPMHKTLHVQLPDLRVIACNVDFSVRTFNASINLCKDLGIRHPEELSLCKPLQPDDLKQNYQETLLKKRPPPPTKDGKTGERIDTNTFISNTGRRYHSNGSLNGTLRTPHKNGNAPFYSNPGTLRNGNYSPYTNGHGPATPPFQNSFSQGALNGSGLSAIDGGDLSLAHSQPPPEATKEAQLHPRTLVERARMNVGWLDSSLSIMEQGVREFDTLLLRFKYFSFYDLSHVHDAVRINQIYEQAKWQILNEEIDCTEEEMLLFAALQLQVTLQSDVQQPQEIYEEDDDVDAALKDLEISLEGPMSNGRNLTDTPRLGGFLRYFRPKRFTLKSFKSLYFELLDLNLYAYRSKLEGSRGESKPVFTVSLKGCEVTPEINLSQRKFQIKLEVPSTEGMTEMWLRCKDGDEYARWMAACRLAAKGKSLADSSYDAEVKSIETFLVMQKPASAPIINPDTIDLNVEDYVAPRFLRKLKSKLRQKILEAQANVNDLNLLEAKMNFIKAWQSLPDYGVSLFVVKFLGEKKEELLGVASNRIMRMTLNNGDHIKTWRFSTMKAWNVNWETKYMMIQLDDERNENVIFNCLSADCKVVHEFIGGYIFLSMRSKDANQQLNEDLFHKLTGGWV
ncbi:unc-112-related protein-like isoform X3 [Tigriopus californicus]|uniref:unc-112-related protein-like isoform X3 n=1 Tax=Tigriopus californicus TaxID=6832 RepID=UPI0027DA1514|nr:unc-112-related protein-like isoform X3 [Tigriopus californicus]